LPYLTTLELYQSICDRRHGGGRIGDWKWLKKAVVT